MKIELINEDRLINMNKLFSDHFENKNCFAYHGTSTFYSAKIEQDGLCWPFFPIESVELRSLATSIPKGNEDLANALIRASERATRIALSPCSYIAAKHSIEKKGGQVMGLCRMAIMCGRIASSALHDKIRMIYLTDVCVYAIDITDNQCRGISFENGVYQLEETIPFSLIHAKLIIPHDFDNTQLKRD